MEEKIEKLKEIMSGLSTKSLMKIIEDDFNDYEKYAVDIAKEEFEKRKDDFEDSEQITDETSVVEKHEETENSLNSIYDNISLLSDEKLEDLLKNHSTEYRATAINYAISEAQRRNLEIVSLYKQLRDLMVDTPFELVEKAIRNLYPEQVSYIGKYSEIYAYLLNISPNSNENGDQLNFIYEDGFWKATGIDRVHNEQFGLEFYKWGDLLSLQVKNEQIHNMGKANYAAIILTNITQFGFSENEIQTYFNKMDTEGYDGNQNEYLMFQNNGIGFNDAIDGAIILKQKIAEKLKEEQELSQVRPWIRFWARTIDISIILLPLGFIWFSLFPNIYRLDSKYACGFGYSIINFLIWAFIEALLISKWGYTPGKWILNVKVRDKNSGNLIYNKSFKRILLVLLYGYGLCVPIISAIANIISYRTLVLKGITKWDERMDVVVTHQKIGVYKIILAIFLLIALPIAMFFMYHSLMN